MTENNKYQRGKIYKLISNQTEDVYYGSTIEDKITNRLSKHRGSYKRWLSKKSKYTTSYEIVKYDDCKIILVENYPCDTKYELAAQEQYYIDNFSCVNKQKAPTGLSKENYSKQFYIEHKHKINEKNKQYYIEHKHKINKKNKQYYIDHKHKINEKIKQYYIEHVDEKKEYGKQYYYDHKEIVTCCCGGNYIHQHKIRHLQTKKHQNYLLSQATTIE